MLVRRGVGGWSRRTWIALAILVVVAVGIGGTVLLASSGLLGRKPTVGPVVPSPSSAGTPSPSRSPASVVGSLDCKIAFADATWRAGWITFPGGQLTYDPAGAVDLPGELGGYLFGKTYDAALGRWVAVPRAWVTPDGQTYVFMSQAYPGNIAVIEKNGARRLLPMPTDQQGALYYWTIISAEPEGIYVNVAPGLLLVGWDGSYRWITHDGNWEAVGGGAAYGIPTAATTSTASIHSAISEAAASSLIVRVDLVTGNTTEFFSRPGMNLEVVGFGPGAAPIVSATSDTLAEVWLAAPMQVKIMSRSLGGPTRHFRITSVVADSHGTWIAAVESDSSSKINGGGLFLYSPSAGLEPAASAIGSLGSSCT